MSYWLKGGIIGLVLDLIYNLFELIFYKTDIKNWLIYLVMDLIFVFIIGAIIGLIFDIIIRRKNKKKLKMKKRKKETNNERKRR